MPKHLTCDICKSDDNCTEDYNGCIYCHQHRLEAMLAEMKERQAHDIAWLRNVWGDQLLKRQKDIAAIKAELERINGN